MGYYHQRGSIVYKSILIIEDNIQHEGATDPAWNQVNIKELDFDFAYDVQAFFQEFSYLKQTKIAELAGLNPSLLLQYANGIKHPSADRVRKIEESIHQLTTILKAVNLTVASAA